MFSVFPECSLVFQITSKLRFSKKKKSSSHADLEERSLGVGQAEIKELGGQWARLERWTDPIQLFPSYE